MSTQNDGFRARGELRIELKRADGSIDQYLVKNLMVRAGTEFVAARMIGDAPAVVSHMAVGEGVTPAAGEDSGLESELERVPVTTSRNGNIVTYTGVFGAGVGTGAVTEAALLNAAVAGTMTCRSVFGVKTKGPLDVMTITWDNIIEAA